MFVANIHQCWKCNVHDMSHGACFFQSLRLSVVRPRALRQERFSVFLFTLSVQRTDTLFANRDPMCVEDRWASSDPHSMCERFTKREYTVVQRIPDKCFRAIIVDATVLAACVFAGLPTSRSNAYLSENNCGSRESTSQILRSQDPNVSDVHASEAAQSSHINKFFNEPVCWCVDTTSITLLPLSQSVAHC